jgi:hypothetical protein
MKIVETAIISQNPQYLKELTRGFPLEKETVLDIDVYRFEIDEELTILLYDLNTKEKIPPPVLEHLSRHLSGFLLITDTRVAEFPPNLSVLADDIANNLTDIPTVVAVRTEEEKLQALNEAIVNSGFYLSEKGRVLFWAPETEHSKRRIWSTIWNDLQFPAS